ncbi:hypothetical protein [Gordonia soli]|uniref:Uncharacterized protein n=1 Tax=Gordonia soli NBRC 108243 TaxID=1223545 RepID=M0QD22_9ACTN|nr:hypothetical protein [Gordonia soli]GAC66455.1 hypothetical protein GS4_02_01660 [Gordonia soli NBRC 108243]
MSNAATGRAPISRRRRQGAIAATICAGAAVVTTVTAGGATAVPEYSNYQLATTVRCDVPDPWPTNRPVPVSVDVFTGIQHPADGLPGPAISLIGSDRRQPGALEYTSETTVKWKNLTTGRTGSVLVPTRGRSLTWGVVLHPGRGPVAFTIRQKVGALAGVPMVNPQYSTCSGRATA